MAKPRRIRVCGPTKCATTSAVVSGATPASVIPKRVAERVGATLGEETAAFTTAGAFPGRATQVEIRLGRGCRAMVDAVASDHRSRPGLYPPTRAILGSEALRAMGARVRLGRDGTEVICPKVRGRGGQSDGR